MKLKIILSAALLAASALLGAQAGEGEAVDPAELQQQLEQARQDLAEAAQRMARLQRELVQTQGGEGWAWKGMDGEGQDFTLDLDIQIGPEHFRHLSVAGFPPRLGVLLGDPASADRNLVIGVTPGSGAEQAGIRHGDRLISVDGQDVTEETSDRIRQLLSGRASGDSVDVMIQRGDDNEHIMPVTLGSALHDIHLLGERMAPMMQNIERQIIRIGPDGMTPAAPPMPPIPPMPPSLAGLGHDTHLISNHIGLKPYFGIAEGILVLRIAEDNPLNLETGDVILRIDGEPVNRPVDFGRALLKHEDGEAVTLQVMRQGALTDVYGAIPERTRPQSGTRRIEVIRQRVEPDVS